MPRDNALAPKPKKKAGRPTAVTQKACNEICERLASGETLISICDDDHMPSMASVMRALRRDEAFREQYARAREDQAELDADRQLRIAAKANPMTWQCDRLVIDALRWRASKMYPKKYSERIQADVTGDFTAKVAYDVNFNFEEKAPAKKPSKATKQED